MPFVSQAQKGFMFAKHPEIAKRWAHKYGIPKNLPRYKGGMKRVLADHIKRRKRRRRKY